VHPDVIRVISRCHPEGLQARRTYALQRNCPLLVISNGGGRAAL
jgi:hypothetical protein